MTATEATKEAAAAALKELEDAALKLDWAVSEKSDRDEVKRCLGRVQVFLEAAQKRLPKAATVQADRDKRRKPKQHKAVPGMIP